MLRIGKLVGLGIGALSALAVCLPAMATDYPSRPITLVAPYGPGGASDLHARVVAGTATAYLKQAVLAVNKTGAAGVIGSQPHALSARSAARTASVTSRVVACPPRSRGSAVPAAASKMAILPYQTLHVRQIVSRRWQKCSTIISRSSTAL